MPGSKRSMKKQNKTRRTTGAGEATTSSVTTRSRSHQGKSGTLDGRLSSNLWARVLHFLFFQEVLNCCGLNSFFRHNVPTYLRLLLIQNSRLLLNLPASVLTRYSNVRRIYIYSLLEETPGASVFDAARAILEAPGRPPMSMADAFKQARDNVPPPTYRLDNTTLKHAVTFLTSFPQLKQAFIGGLCRCANEEHCAWSGEIHCDVGFSSELAFSTDNAVEKFSEFLVEVCRAYASKRLSDQTNFRGLFPPYRYGRVACPWQDLSIIPTHRLDVDCQLCDLLCLSFPPLQVLSFTDGKIPCIAAADRMKIAYGRDPLAVQGALTDLLVAAVEPRIGCPVLFPPPTYQHHGFAAVFDGEDLERMQGLISMGANAKDERIRQQFVRRPPGPFDDDGPPTGWDTTGTYNKRMIILPAFEGLKGLGFDISREDFQIIDITDMRNIPEYNRR